MPELAKNRKAYHDFHVLDKLEAGIVLTGTEVKSCRARNFSLQEAYVQIDNGEAFIINMHINPYEKGNINNHEPRRKRKLLLHKREIVRIKRDMGEKGLTIVPLSFYLKGGLIKVQIGICRGKSHGDKREDLKAKQAKREMDRAVKRALG
jgi:SsrA-binding protein